MTFTLSEVNFGEYEARREYHRDKSFFTNTFLTPLSFSLDTLSSKKNFILIGRKGTGKTACQIFLKNQKEAEGYLCEENRIF